MSTSNPFEKLHVKHDVEEDEQGEFEKVTGKEKNVPIGIEAKKRKVRPKEKVEQEDGEGFEEVKNRIQKKKQKYDDEEEGKGNEHKARRGINFHTNEDREYRESKRPTRGRKYDRQSGTGRGKEVSKGGAGGKGTWGDNPKNIAKDFENNYDEYYFEEALNPEKREKRERPPRRNRKDEKKEEGEEKGNENEGEEEKNDKKEEREEKRRPKKTFEPKPLKEEEKLVIPKDAEFLGDYLKSKEKPKEDEDKKEVKRVQDGKPLTKVEDKKADELGTSQPGKKKPKKKKEKDINKEEVDLNFQIGSNLEIGGGIERQRGGANQKGRGRGRERGGKGRRRGGYDRKDEGGFIYNPDDFPKLK